MFLVRNEIFQELDCVFQSLLDDLSSQFLAGQGGIAQRTVGRDLVKSVRVGQI
jgi:hypothetical protein